MRYDRQVMAAKSPVRPMGKLGVAQGKVEGRQAAERPEGGRGAAAGERARPASEPGRMALVCVVAWAIPGAGHFWLGQRQKATVFFTSLLLMFVTGLLLSGRLFPFEFSDPLGALAAVANAGMGLPWIVARLQGAGAGTVTAITYEYGNCFLIVAGLLNFLVILDAYDVAVGRK
jgi:hypothetical protein